jgi:methylthioribose-1-phosphate isomerase
MKKTLYWSKSKLYLLDQRILPHKITYVRCLNSGDVAYAIKKMIIRGAPAIGIAAAFGLVLASKEKEFKSREELYRFLSRSKDKLSRTRPTAVNLFWAIKRMNDRLADCIARREKVKSIRRKLEQEAKKILTEDVECNKKIGMYGSKLLKPNSVVITHCNAGALATGGYGTALGVIREAYRKNKIKMVYVDETRPYLQGARLTAWELKQESIPCRLICDDMAGYIMKFERVNAVVVGADRIASNGDTANKIGTYSLAVLARYHDISFYVAAPWSTVDTKISSGRNIPIEERSSDEVTKIFGKKIAPEGITARHPAFDITPNKLITSIITERGVYKYPYKFK